MSLLVTPAVGEVASVSSLHSDDLALPSGPKSLAEANHNLGGAPTLHNASLSASLVPKPTPSPTDAVSSTILKSNVREHWKNNVGLVGGSQHMFQRGLPDGISVRVFYDAGSPKLEKKKPPSSVTTDEIDKRARWFAWLDLIYMMQLKLEELDHHSDGRDQPLLVFAYTPVWNANTSLVVNSVGPGRPEGGLHGLLDKVGRNFKGLLNDPRHYRIEGGVFIVTLAGIEFLKNCQGRPRQAPNRRDKNRPLGVSNSTRDKNKRGHKHCSSSEQSNRHKRMFLDKAQQELSLESSEFPEAQYTESISGVSGSDNDLVQASSVQPPPHSAPIYLDSQVELQHLLSAMNTGSSYTFSNIFEDDSQINPGDSLMTDAELAQFIQLE